MKAWPSGACMIKSMPTIVYRAGQEIANAGNGPESFGFRAYIGIVLKDMARAAKSKADSPYCKGVALKPLARLHQQTSRLR